VLLGKNSVSKNVLLKEPELSLTYKQLVDNHCLGLTNPKDLWEFILLDFEVYLDSKNDGVVARQIISKYELKKLEKKAKNSSLSTPEENEFK